MDYYQHLCKHIARLHKNILIADIVENGSITASYSKPLIPRPKPDRSTTMLAQAHLLVSIPKTNEDFFGKACFTMIYHEGLHIFLFPISKTIRRPSSLLLSLSNNSNKNNIMAKGRIESNLVNCLFLMVVKPHYSFDDLIPKIMQELKAAGCNLMIDQ